MAGKTIKPAGCEIMSCTCSHEFQDRRYGKGRRVCNAKKCKTGGLEYKCTVCGKIHGSYAPAPEVKDVVKETVSVRDAK